MFRFQPFGNNNIQLIHKIDNFLDIIRGNATNAIIFHCITFGAAGIEISRIFFILCS